MDQLPNLTTSDKEVEFVTEINSDGDFDENKPDQALIMNLPYSSIGVNFGVRFDLN
jgi:hypothetical protein